MFSGCTLRPTPLTDAERKNEAYRDIEDIVTKQSKVSQKITLAEALARSLKYNLDHRIEQAQILLESGKLQSAYLSMLPGLRAEVDYSGRDKSTVQKSILGGTVYVNNESAYPRETRTDIFNLEWNLLDLGLSYTRAQQQSQKVLMAEENRRKIVQKFVEDVVEAYWKAWAAQNVQKALTRVLKALEGALKRSENIIKKEAGPLENQLDYQSQLIRLSRQLKQLDMDAKSAQHDLARMMSLPCEEDMALEDPHIALQQLPLIEADLEKMATLALVLRPELRSSAYATRLARWGVRESVLGIFPKLAFDFGYTRTTNNLVVNSSWMGGNVRASLDLIQTLIKGPQGIGVAESQFDLEEIRRKAATMGVLTQVRLAYQTYLSQRDAYRLYTQESDVLRSLLEQSLKNEKALQGDEQSTIRRACDSLSAYYSKDLAFAKAYASFFRMYGVLGLDLIDMDVTAVDLKTLSQKIETLLIQRGYGDLKKQIDDQYTRIKTPVVETPPKEDETIVGEFVKYAKVLFNKTTNIFSADKTRPSV